jgi:tetratricopeptide (TPR) repeat protein
MKKAERRHELEHNELDDALVRFLHVLRENGVVIAVAVGAVILAVGLYVYMFAGTSISADAGLWQKYMVALSDAREPKKELESFIDKQDRDGKGADPAVLWAKLSLGEMLLAEGDRELFENREAARDSLEAAEKTLLAAEKHAARKAELRDRIHLALAKVYESQNEPKKAQEYYDKVAKASPESPLGKLAARGERRLGLESNQKFLAWFAQQKPKPPSKKTSPLDMKNPPEVPDFSLPPLEGSDDKPITPGLKLPSKLPDETTEPEPEDQPKRPKKTEPDKNPDEEPEGSPE